MKDIMNIWDIIDKNCNTTGLCNSVSVSKNMITESYDNILFD